MILGVGAGHLEGEFDALGVPFADARRAARRGDRRHRRGVDRRVPDLTGRAGRRTSRPAAASGAAAAAADLDRRLRASRRCAASPNAATAGSRRARRASRCPTTIAYVLEHREKVRPGVPIDFGFIHEYVYVGDADVGVPRLHGVGFDAAHRRQVQRDGRDGREPSAGALAGPRHRRVLRPDRGVRLERSAPTS